MNINKYIEKNSEIKESDDGELSITLNVPPMKIVDYTWQENDATQHIKLNTENIHSYLSSKGYHNTQPATRTSTDNKHPRGLTATWVFTLPKKEAPKPEPTKSSKRTKRTKRKTPEYSEE